MPLYIQRQTVAPRPGPWTGSVTFKQIDPALGIVTAGLSLTGTIDSTLVVESGEASASTFRSTASGVVTLDRPDGSLLLSAAPTASVTVQLAAADGVADNAGPSGRTVLGMARTDRAAVVSAPGNGTGTDLSLLTGTGSVTLPVTASARVLAMGAGNVQAIFHTSVAAGVVTAVQTAPSAGPGSPLGSGFQGVQPPYVTSFVPGSVTSAMQTQRMADQTTGSTSTLTFNGFDRALGTLEYVTVQIAADSVGGISAENLDAVAGNVTISQSATESLSLADGTVAEQATARDSLSQTLGAADGATDFAGVAGVSVTGLVGEGHSTVDIGGAALANFMRPGPVTLALSSLGQTTIDGTGNLAVTTTLKAGATVNVTYTYLPGGTQPATPAVSGLVGAGLTHVLTGSDPAQTVAAAGTLVVPAGPTNTAIAVLPGGIEHVVSGALNVGTQTVGQAAPGGGGAVLTIDTGGTANNVTLLSGGTGLVNGQAAGMVVDGGLAVVNATGSVSLSTVRWGTVSLEGGTSHQSTVLAGGMLVVDGGSSVDDVLHGGQADIVRGHAAGITLEASGVLTVERGAAANGVTFHGGGTLVLRAGGAAMGLQGFGLGNTIDLRDVAFGTYVHGTLDSAGLHVMSGGGTTDLTLTGARGFTAADIRLSADDAGTGTVVTLAPGGLSSPGGNATSDYVGPVAGVEHQFVAISPSTVVASASTDNWFLHGGTGDNALAAHGGRNVLDGGGGSNFLVGGTGTDSFFVTAAATTTWSTIVGAHAGDDVTLWGVDPALSWQDGQGAAGYTGLTLTTVASGVITKATLAGYTAADLAAGRITVQSGTDAASHLSYEYLAFH